MHPAPLETIAQARFATGKTVTLERVADRRTPYRVVVVLSGGHVLPPSYHTTREAAERTYRGHNHE
jgi:hypothetical protein